MSFLNLITAGSGQIAQAVQKQFHVTKESNSNVLSIKTLADDSSVATKCRLQTQCRYTKPDNHRTQTTSAEKTYGSAGS
ncbi:hypothetical protein [Aeromonas sp. 600276]|uniref:hypothetical protein n=1 Tax=Aeromonas sp. 600276 TaxID=2712026 RepID=UPI003B9E451F